MIKVSFFYDNANKNVCFVVPTGYDEIIVEPDGKKIWVTFLYPEPEPQFSLIVPSKYYRMEIKKA